MIKDSNKIVNVQQVVEQVNKEHGGMQFTKQIPDEKKLLIKSGSTVSLVQRMRITDQINKKNRRLMLKSSQSTQSLQALSPSKANLQSQQQQRQQNTQSIGQDDVLNDGQVRRRILDKFAIQSGVQEIENSKGFSKHKKQKSS